MATDPPRASTAPHDPMGRQADRLLLSAGWRGGWSIWLLALATLAAAGADILLPTAIGHALDTLPGCGGITANLLVCAGLIAIMVAS